MLAGAAAGGNDVRTMTDQTRGDPDRRRCHRSRPGSVGCACHAAPSDAGSW
jgi:hypothetical protein